MSELDEFDRRAVVEDHRRPHALGRRAGRADYFLSLQFFVKIVDLEGNVVHGPAPRPLPWLEVTADAAGNLVVDTSIVIPHGKVTRA